MRLATEGGFQFLLHYWQKYQTISESLGNMQILSTLLFFYAQTVKLIRQHFLYLYKFPSLKC